VHLLWDRKCKACTHIVVLISKWKNGGLKTIWPQVLYWS